jgi:Cu+-exporting ATPase
METLALGIDGMQCGACAASVEKLLYSVAGVQSAAVWFVGGEAEITFDPLQTDADALARAVAEAGYAARVMGDLCTAPQRAPAG